MSGSKTFDVGHHAENDLVAKRTGYSLLRSLGYSALTPYFKQKEAYKDWDFQVVSKSGRVVCVEVERKLGWDCLGWWPEQWNSVDVAYRKKDSCSDLFIMTNNACDTALIVPMQRVLGSPVYYKDTIYTKHEKFFAVPPSRCFFYFMEYDESGEWLPITHKGLARNGSEAK